MMSDIDAYGDLIASPTPVPPVNSNADIVTPTTPAPPINPYRDLVTPTWPATHVNPYDDVAEDLALTAEARASLVAARGSDPDVTARALVVSRRLGVSVDMVEQNLPDYEAVDRINRYDELLTRSPAMLKRWMAEPVNARLIGEDLPAFVGTAGVWRGLADAGRSVAAGLIHVPGAILSGAGWGYDVVASSFGRATGLRPSGQAKNVPWYLDPAELLKSGGKYFKDTADMIGVPVERKNFVDQVFEGVGQIGGQIATIVGTGGIGALSLLFAQGVDQMADDVEKSGKAGTVEGDLALVGGGMVTALAERAGLGVLLNRVPPAIRNKFVRTVVDVAAAGGIEAAEEVVEQIGQNAVANYFLQTNKHLLDGALDSAAPAGSSAALVHAALLAVGRGRGRSVPRVNQPAEDAAALDQVVAATRATGLSSRSPDKLAEVLGALGDTGKVHVPAHTVRTYLQTLDVQDAQQQVRTLGIDGQLEQAMATGGDVVIPLHDYVAHAPETMTKAWRDDLRLRESGLSISEARSFKEGISELGDVVANRIEEETRQVAARDRVVTTVEQQLRAAGEAPEVAQQIAQLYGERYATRAARLGQGDAVSQYGRSGVSFRVALPASLRNTGVARGEAAPKEPAIPQFIARNDEAQDPPLLTASTSGNKTRIGDKGEASQKSRGPSYNPKTESDGDGVNLTVEQSGDKGTPRGKIVFTQDKAGRTRSLITLFKDRNLSTVLHETGHLWLEELHADAALLNAPQQLKADLATARAYLGAEGDAALTVEQHEKWARTVEAHFLEGTSPSIALSGVMARFKVWMISIYRTVARLNVDINDEVRGVIDRTIAIDEAITATQAELHARPLFASAAQAGMTDIQFTAYGKSVVEASERATQAMLARQEPGTLPVDGAIEAKALTALHNDARADMLMAELDAMAHMAGTKSTPYGLARDWARSTIAEKTAIAIKDVEAYTRAESRAAFAAQAALAKGDIGAALQRKQEQVIAHALWREAHDARVRIATARAETQLLATGSAIDPSVIAVPKLIGIPRSRVAARQTVTPGATAPTTKATNKRAEEIYQRRVKQFPINKRNGLAFEEEQAALERQRDVDVGEQITLETQNGLRGRVDLLIRDHATGKFSIVELKASLRARFRKKQRAFHEDVSKVGARIVGAGKPKFEGGLKVPPSPYTLRRKHDTGE